MRGQNTTFNTHNTKLHTYSLTIVLLTKDKFISVQVYKIFLSLSKIVEFDESELLKLLISSKDKNRTKSDKILLAK